MSSLRLSLAVKIARHSPLPLLPLNSIYADAIEHRKRALNPELGRIYRALEGVGDGVLEGPMSQALFMTYAEKARSMESIGVSSIVSAEHFISVRSHHPNSMRAN